MKRKPLKIDGWLRRVEALIGAASTTPRTRGKYKGHGSTDVSVWLGALTTEVWQGIKREHGRSIAFDENLAIAARLGAILVIWYACCHRAKTYDQNRPLRLRRQAARRLEKYRERLFTALTSDKVIAKVWPWQELHPPYGKGARSGRFV